MVELKRCSKCVLPETQDAITFDENGVCMVCKQSGVKESIDWKAKKKELDELVAEYRGKADYDCLIPFSGGKDSTFTAYYLMKNYDLNPLLITFDHGFMRPTMRQNVEHVVKQLGVDHLTFKPDWNVVKKVMYESLKRKGDFCWHCHCGIFAFPMRVAAKFKVPLIFWGEKSTEYMAYYGYDEDEEVDERRFNRYTNLGITAEDMVGMVEGLTLKDLQAFTYPKLEELKALKYRSVCLGSYIPWDARKQTEMIKKELGWKTETVEGVPGIYDYDKIECMVEGVRDWLKYIKRGFGRTAHLASVDIRNGRMTRKQAMEYLKEFDGKRPASLDYFLEIMGMTEDEFMGLALKNVVSPWAFSKEDAKKAKRGKELWDQKQWDRTR